MNMLRVLVSVIVASLLIFAGAAHGADDLYALRLLPTNPSARGVIVVLERQSGETFSVTSWQLFWAR
jgi:hypothetical protein